MLGDEQIDSEISYHRRTIPPISGMSNGTSPPPEANNQTVEQRGGVSMSDMEREKDEEAQRELDDLFAAGGVSSLTGFMSSLLLDTFCYLHTYIG